MKILLLFILIMQSSFATVYLAAYDKSSQSWGLAYSSSGGNFRIKLEKDKGIIGFGSYGSCHGIDANDLFKLNLSAKEVTDRIYKWCQRQNWEKFRMTAVTSDGVTSSLIAKQGCHYSNKNCGERVSKTFVITGGGLRRKVHKRVFKFYKNIEKTDQALECKLLKTLQYLYKVGGEKLEFVGAAVLVDSIDRPEASKFLIKRNSNQKETYLLQHLKDQMNYSGIRCD
jgi:hypothetical protein